MKNIIWLFLALASAVFVALNNVITKKLSFSANEDTILYGKYLFAALFSTILIFFIDIPKIKPSFYYSIVIASIIDIIGFLFLIKAIVSADLGKAYPLVAFTPIFLILTAFFILGELPSLLGIFGIIIIVSGAYLLRLGSAKISLLEPFKLLFREKGPKYVLLTAFSFSLAGPFFKKAILNSSPWFALFARFLLATVLLTFIFLLRKRIYKIYKQTITNFKLLFLNGVTTFLITSTIFLAFQFTLTVYAISVKRTSILFTIILGFIFFKEKDFTKSLVAGVVMMVGLFLIALG